MRGIITGHDWPSLVLVAGHDAYIAAPLGVLEPLHAPQERREAGPALGGVGGPRLAQGAHHADV